MKISRVHGFDGLYSFISQPLFVQSQLVSASQVHKHSDFNHRNFFQRGVISHLDATPIEHVYEDDFVPSRIT